jgi:FtsH-binding integral membrane protein
MDRLPNSPRKTYPKEFMLAQLQTYDPKLFNEGAFFTWTIEKVPSKKWGFAVFTIILGVCLFPVWPYLLKYGIFLLSFWTLIILVLSPLFQHKQTNAKTSSARFLLD